MADQVSIAKIAERIRAGYESSWRDGITATAEFYADEIIVGHVPTQPEKDGVKSAADALSYQLAEQEAVLGYLTDAKITCREWSTRDDAVVMDAALTGTLPSGEPFRHEYLLVHVIENGKVTSLVAEYDPAGNKALAAAHDTVAPATGTP